MQKNIRSLQPTEHQIQCAIIEWANITKYGKFTIGDFLIAIPNGGYRNKREAVKLKKEGVKKGVSDLFLAMPIFRNGYMSDFYSYCGLWLEVKKKGKKPRDEQLKWLSEMRRIGYASQWCDTTDMGIKHIKDYLGMK